jgi:glucose-6-phosphate-specific signal transduction histidine kinase
MKLTPEILWVALAALIIGLVLGYGLRRLVSLLRSRRMHRELSSMPSGQPGRFRRMEPQSDRDWRRELEDDLSQVTTAPLDNPDAAP